MPIRAPLEQIVSLSFDTIIVDTNVLLYVFGTVTTSRKDTQSRYSKALVAARNAGKRLLVDLTVLSEFANRELRVAFDLYRAQTGRSDLDLKRDFRDSAEYRETKEATCQAMLSTILKLCRAEAPGYSRDDARRITASFCANDLDINDQVLIELCNQTGSVLLTNDSDFKHAAVDIVSGNPKLLE